jgi:hypothetical protein
MPQLYHIYPESPEDMVLAQQSVTTKITVTKSTSQYDIIDVALPSISAVI